MICCDAETRGKPWESSQADNAKAKVDPRDSWKKFLAMKDFGILLQTFQAI